MGWGNKKGSGGDVVLESRHLVGLFLVLVVVSGVFYTLGYVMGRSQYDSQLRGAASAEREASPPAGSVPTAKGPAAAPVVAPAPSEWDFYRSGESGKPVKGLDPLQQKEPAAGAAKPKPTETVSAKPKPASHPNASRAKPALGAPLIPRGAIVLQVAALTRESDALALAEVLQRKKFPAFVLTPGPDQYYRVQVGPYGEARSANAAKHGLENEGFKPIVKR